MIRTVPARVRSLEPRLRLALSRARAGIGTAAGRLRALAEVFVPAPGVHGSPSYDSLLRQLRAAAILSGILVFGIGGWACLTSFSGAVIAPGQVVVESEVKKVQHPVGGVVGALNVREGDRVRSGQVLVRLDDTQIRANLDIVVKSLDETTARRARDEAEQRGADAPTFPAEFLERAKTDPTVANLIAGETAFFTIRRATRGGQKAQLNERVAQLNHEITGLNDQSRAKEGEIALIQNELQGLRELRQKNLIPVSRVTALEREATRLDGERGQLLAAIAQAKGKISETELQILQIDQDMRAEVAKELADIRAKTSEYVEKRVVAEDALRHIDLRAPQDGIVHQMSVHTIGGLVTPSEPAMLIVPQADALAVDVKIRPEDIDHVHVGQQTVLRFTAFDQRTTPEINGVVDRLSPDVTKDAKSGMNVYTARIAIGEEESRRLGKAKLRPGMPVESFIKTTERTVISFLTKPLADQVAKAWREN
ncbi:HlyD family type I secretion periplasmic adaptor subunit [Methylobacterium sp. J-059]|uniref:HlyD family type I secretion periplasmic adaptor subunit n=1 Tax=Methylobacterium sp. J-059 TaxID=2836643 RepID=UPI001FBAC283|nr:HlyD family type I secretion periplasmic adaptor subunit [Methylobacterium sp. J-059]MCJ2041889.1 HlyD family type I secretion periplasmic adaptor subunit [Methylobacterium sp. J-059]